MSYPSKSIPLGFFMQTSFANRRFTVMEICFLIEYVCLTKTSLQMSELPFCWSMSPSFSTKLSCKKLGLWQAGRNDIDTMKREMIADKDWTFYQMKFI